MLAGDGTALVFCHAHSL